MPRDIIEIIENEQEEILVDFSDQVILEGFGMYYSKITENTKLKKRHMIHVYQGLEGIEGVLSEVKPEGEIKTISEIYVKPCNDNLS